MTENNVPGDAATPASSDQEQENNELEEIVEDFAMFNQAANNNRVHILAELKRLLIVGDSVLELGSGSGQHAAFFASEMPGVTWMPTDRGPYFSALDANLSRLNLANLERVQYLDVEEFPEGLSADVAFCANVLHIMPESLIPNLFAGVAECLGGHGTLVIYGPFKYDGEFTTPSNEQFDGWLKDQEDWQGIRDIEVVVSEAERNGMRLAEDVAMPANNQLLVFRTTSH